MKNKKPNFKELYPLVWNQYQFIAQVRLKLDETINYLMALISLTTIVYLQLYNKKVTENPIFLIPIVFLFLIPIIIFFANFTPKLLWVHFIETIYIKKVYSDNKNVYEKFVRDILGVYPHLTEYRRFKRIIITLLLNSLYLGLFSIIITPLIESKNYCYLSITFLVGFGLLFYLNRIFWKKEYARKSVIEEANKLINDWLGKS